MGFDTLHCSMSVAGSAAQFNSSVSAMPPPPSRTFETPAHPGTADTLLLRSTMKVFFALWSVLLLVQSAAVAGLADMPRTNRVVVASGKWKPSEPQVQEALADIQAYLEKPSHWTNDWSVGEIKTILAHTPHYRVEMTGVVFDRKRVILCMFWPLIIDVDPWTLHYDPKTGKCMRSLSFGYR
jgi:hypothetical protein